MRTVDVVIVNWNAGPLLKQAVEAVRASEQSAFRFGRIVVVDNASSDGSVDFLDEDATAAQPSTIDHRLSTLGAGETPAHPPVTLIRNVANRGFAAACNQGAAGSEADYLLFLNPDTRVEPNTLDVSVRTMENAPRTGILGVQLVDEHGTPQLSCARFPTPTRYTWKAVGLDRLLPTVFEPHYLTGFDHRHSREVDQVMGAYFFVRRELFEPLGGFDERFFVYFEEVDFAWRAREAGWTTMFCADARAYHQGGGTTDRIRARRLAYSLESRLHFAQKHFRPVGVAAVLLSSILIELPTRLLYGTLSGSRQNLRDTLVGYIQFTHSIPTVLRGSSKLDR